LQRPPEEVTPSAGIRYEIWRAAWQRLFGYDFFISYAWVDGRPYAEALERGLSAPPQRFRCFIDQKEMGGGEAWRASVRKALRRSSVMVLVASSAALERDNVLEEIETFSARGRPLIPIDVGARIGALSTTHRARPYLEERLRFEEQEGPTRLVSGEPSPDALNFLIKSFGFVRIGRLRSVILGTLVFVFAGLAVLAGLSYLAEREARQRAQLQESRALATLAERASASGDQPTAILLALEALPSPAFGGDRPLSSEAAAALREAWTWNKETTLAGHGDSISAAAFSSDGRRIIFASGDGTARVWDISGLRPIASGPYPAATVLDGHHARAVGFGADGFGPWLSADGRYKLSSDAKDSAWLWDLAKSDAVAIQLPEQHGRVWDASFSPDGRYVATGSDDGKARVWDLSDPHQIHHVFEGSKVSGQGITPVAFSQDGGRIAQGSDDGVTRIWDLSRPESPIVILQPEGISNKGDRARPGVARLTFSRDGRRLAIGHDSGAVIVWDLSGPQPVSTNLDGLLNVVAAVSFSTSGDGLVAADADGSVRVWDLSGPRPFANVLPSKLDPSKLDWSQAAAFSPDGGRVVIAFRDGSATLWDLLRAGQGTTIVGQQKDPVQSVAFHGSSMLFATAPYAVRQGDRVVSGNGMIRLWESREPDQQAKVLNEFSGSIDRISDFSADEHHVVGETADGTLRAWDLSKQNPMGVVLGGYSGWVLNVALSANGQRAISAHSDSKARVWDLSGPTPALATVLEGHSNEVTAAAFSQDGSWVVTGSDDRTSRVWDLSRSKPELVAVLDAPAEGDTKGVTVVAFSTDRRQVAIGSKDGTARVWNLSGSRPVATDLPGHFDWPRAAAFSPDGGRVAIAYEDGAVRLWDLSGRPPVASVIDRHIWHETKYAVRTVAFNSDGDRVVTGSDDGTVRVLRTYPNIAELSKLVVTRLSRCLSITQRENFGLSVDNRTAPRDFIPTPDAAGRCPH
jgi:WD40 repeat protein